MSGLVLSGLTAFPLEAELQIAYELFPGSLRDSALGSWLGTVYEGVRFTNAEFPFMAYGTDWLAFAHLVIAIAFIGPLKDPVRNIWVIEFGLIACAAIFPFAFLAGAVRGIPLYWRLVDCLFGFTGGLVLLFCYRDIRKLQNCK
jgi:hypothetical protein